MAEELTLIEALERAQRALLSERAQLRETRITVMTFADILSGKPEPGAVAVLERLREAMDHGEAAYVRLGKEIGRLQKDRQE